MKATWIKATYRLLTTVSLLLCAQGAYSLTYPLPAGNTDIIGEVQEVKPLPGESLFQIARRFDIGLYEIREANQHLERMGVNEAFPAGTRIKIPSSFILPPAPRTGIVINLPELRLYYYPPGTNTVVTEPVGIGREGWATPLGITRVVAKEKDPHWYPTESVRADAERLGHPIPKVFPPGPDNPLGNYVLRLSWNTYLIHGTNNPAGVGIRSSAGCIRMYPEDIESLYRQVPIGTQVRVINEPLKMAWENGKLYVEVHQQLSDEPTAESMNSTTLVNKVYDIAHTKGALIQWSSAKDAMARPTGIPTVIASQASKNGEVLGMGVE